jgi:hypothetical protein
MSRCGQRTMVHTTTYRGDQKHDHALLRGNTVPNSQSAICRRKGTQVPVRLPPSSSRITTASSIPITHKNPQNRRQAPVHAPILSLGSCNYQIRLYVDKHGKIKTDSSSTIADDDRHEILKEAIGKYEKVLKGMRAIPAQPSCGIA